MKRKMVAVMLSTAMVFGLAACGGGNDKEASTDTGTKDTKEAEDTKDDAEEADDAGRPQTTRQRNQQQMVTVKRSLCSVRMMETAR